MPISGSASNSGGKNIYKALLNVNEDGDLVPTEIENSIGSISFTTNAAGSYWAITSSGLFTLNKTTVFVTNGADTVGYIYVENNISVNSISIGTRDFLGISTPLILVNASILIEVYP